MDQAVVSVPAENPDSPVSTQWQAFLANPWAKWSYILLLVAYAVLAVTTLFAPVPEGMELAFALFQCTVGTGIVLLLMESNNFRSDGRLEFLVMVLAVIFFADFAIACDHDLMRLSVLFATGALLWLLSLRSRRTPWYLPSLALALLAACFNVSSLVVPNKTHWMFDRESGGRVNGIVSPLAMFRLSESVRGFDIVPMPLVETSVTVVVSKSPVPGWKEAGPSPSRTFEGVVAVTPVPRNRGEYDRIVSLAGSPVRLEVTAPSLNPETVGPIIASAFAQKTGLDEKGVVVTVKTETPVPAAK